MNIYLYGVLIAGVVLLMYGLLTATPEMTFVELLAIIIFAVLYGFGWPIMLPLTIHKGIKVMRAPKS